MKSRPIRVLVVSVLGGLALVAGAPASAQRATAEAPAVKGGTQGTKALNPQPEVPSKPGGKRSAELNPQPEVPSKPAVNPAAENKATPMKKDGKSQKKVKPKE